MKRALFAFVVAGLVLGLCPPGAHSAPADTRMGLGIFVDRSMPVLAFGDRYSAYQKYGACLDYKVSDRTTLEFEYHHANMRDGKIEDRAFYWPIDKKRYYSPDARSEFNLNTLLMNAIVRVTKPTTGDTQLVPYLAIGAGIYDYQDEISGLVYPGQKVQPLDGDLLMEPRKDDHTPLGATLGLGMMVKQGRYGLDLRARYHMFLGELRPMEAWDIQGVFPISMVDLRTAFKLYW